MKDLLVMAIALSLSVSSYAQGSVYFANRVEGEVDAPVFLWGTQRGPGPDWTAQLYLSASNGSLTPLVPGATFGPAGLGGAAIADRYIVNPPTVLVPGVQPGESATFVVRAWLTSLGSFDAAKVVGAFGESAPFTITVSGGALPPTSLTTLQSFTMVIPEPSIIALALLGASILFLRRRGSY